MAQEVIINIGDIYAVEDDITGEITEGEVIFIEQDSEVYPVRFVYLRSIKDHNKHLNDKYDNRFAGAYWTIIPV